MGQNKSKNEYAIRTPLLEDHKQVTYSKERRMIEKLYKQYIGKYKNLTAIKKVLLISRDLFKRNRHRDSIIVLFTCELPAFGYVTHRERLVLIDLLLSFVTKEEDIDELCKTFSWLERTSKTKTE
jgi:hypothetical protein